MAVVAAIGASSYLNLDQGDLEQDTAIQAKRPDSKHLMSAVGSKTEFSGMSAIGAKRPKGISHPASSIDHAVGPGLRQPDDLD